MALLVKQKKKRYAELGLRFIVTRSKVLGKENETAESSFLYFAKALQFYLFCKSLTVLNDVLHLRWYGHIALAPHAHTDTTYFCDIAACSLSK